MAIRRVLAFLLTGALTLAGIGTAVFAFPEQADAAVAPSPALLWSEGFENGTTNAVVGLQSYTGASGEKYTADPYWLDQGQCNGFVMNFFSSTGSCPQVTLAAMTDALGQVAAGTHTSTPATKNNHALTTYSNNADNGQPPSLVELRSLAPVTFTFPSPAAGTRQRYIGFSVDAAETACGARQQAQLLF